MVNTWEDALARMQSALNLIDKTNGPGDVGAYLDLAICRLQEAIGQIRQSAPGSTKRAPEGATYSGTRRTGMDSK